MLLNIIYLVQKVDLECKKGGWFSTANAWKYSNYKFDIIFPICLISWCDNTKLGTLHNWKYSQLDGYRTHSQMGGKKTLVIQNCSGCKYIGHTNAGRRRSLCLKYVSFTILKVNELTQKPNNSLFHQIWSDIM